MDFIREYCAKQLLIVTTDVLRAIQSGGWLHHYSKLGKLPARVMCPACDPKWRMVTVWRQ